MKAVLWFPSAQQDLKLISDYIAQENANAAYATLRIIKATVGNLSIFPNIGKVGRISGTREIVTKGAPYIILYQITDKNIRILAVKHAAQKWPEST